MRHRAWADSMSLNAMASPAAREPGPLVIFVLCLTVAKADSIVILSFHVSQGCDLRRPVVDSVADGTLAA
jgi:hypothetical protein